MKRISRRNFLKAMGISATALTLAACGGSSSSTAAGTAGSTAASAVATGEPKAGGTLRLCYSSPIATPGYTPRATGNAAIYYLTLSYESLTSYDAEDNIIPNLATEWDVNTDELSITWTLREGVKRNIEEYQANNRTETANIAECQIIDDTHIKMMMAEPNSSTLESVGFFVYYMSPKALENPSSLDAVTCGTGPFQLSEFENNAYAIYTKNENYWKEGLPYLDSVEVTLVTESSTANTAFQANEYDMYWVGLANPTILQQLDGAGIYVKEDNQNGMGVESLGLIPNSAIDGPWADARVRRALCYAIDVDAINAAFLMGMAQMTDQWAVPGSATYNDSLNHFTYDPEKAKSLLAEAGYADGFTTNIVTISGMSDMLTAIANMLDEVGIHCNIQQVDGAGIYVKEDNQNGMGVESLGLIPNSAIDGPWADARVRRALCYAIDVDAINAAFLMGMAQMTDQWAVPGSATYNDSLNHFTYDPEKAKSLLAEAGYADGFTTNIVTISGMSDMLTAIANMLDEVGIHCNIQQVDGATNNQYMKDGTWEGLMLHFATIAPDLGLYMGRHLDKNGAYYAKGIQHPDKEMELLEEIRRCMDPDEKHKLEKELQAAIYDAEDGSCLFGRVLYVNKSSMYKYDYVIDDHATEAFTACWDLSACWLNK